MDKPLAAPDLNRQAKLDAFDRLLTIMDELRENCPWDKKQTMETLRRQADEQLSVAIASRNASQIKDIPSHIKDTVSEIDGLSTTLRSLI